MMLKKKSLFVLSFFSIFPLYAAQSIVPTALKTLFHTPLLLLGSFALSKDLILNKVGRPVSASIEAFVKKQAIEKGLDSDSIQVKALARIGLQPMSAGSYTIAISDNYISHLEGLLNKDSLSEKEQNAIQMYQAIVDHELNHITYNDTKKYALAALSIVAFLEGLDFVIIKNSFYLQKFITYMPITSLLMRSSIMGVIGLMAFCAYSRQLEQRADDTISEKLPLLKGMYLFCKKCEPFDRLTPSFLYIFSTHPSFKNRSARFKKRIVLLKQKEGSEI